MSSEAVQDSLPTLGAPAFGREAPKIFGRLQARSGCGMSLAYDGETIKNHPFVLHNFEKAFPYCSSPLWILERLSVSNHDKPVASS